MSTPRTDTKKKKKKKEPRISRITHPAGHHALRFGVRHPSKEGIYSEQKTIRAHPCHQASFSCGELRPDTSVVPLFYERTRLLLILLQEADEFAAMVFLVGEQRDT